MHQQLRSWLGLPARPGRKVKMRFDDHARHLRRGQPRTHDIPKLGDRSRRDDAAGEIFVNVGMMGLKVSEIPTAQPESGEDRQGEK